MALWRDAVVPEGALLDGVFVPEIVSVVLMQSLLVPDIDGNFTYCGLTLGFVSLGRYAQAEQTHSHIAG